ncbi:hypothetical protein [Niameybacter massiliensis]|uniref:hypothetical protein n=1 Tax=Niameybacter massiliensis TaxID=1658108 RepID=UPI0006B6727A|nr:hypothetical protein [Niameybacter massiliensis]
MKVFETNLEARPIKRGEDTDYFIETFSYPLNLEMDHALTSRIQFPMSRAVLIRTSPYSSKVTVHIMRDVDLRSSFANFELELKDHQLSLQKEEGYIQMSIKKR